MAVLLHIGVNGADTITGTGLPGLPTLAKATSGSLTGWLNVAVNIPELSFLICVPVAGTLYSAGNIDGLYIPVCATIPPRECEIDTVIPFCPTPEAALELTELSVIHW